MRYPRLGKAASCRKEAGPGIGCVEESAAKNPHPPTTMTTGHSALLLAAALLLLLIASPAHAWTRQYTLICLEKTLVLDGTGRRMMTFNGTVPGPLLTATDGDTLEITVINK